MPATMVDQREKIKKKHWLKNVSQQSPQKTKFRQKYVIQNLTFGILFLKILLRAYKFFVSVHTFQSTFFFFWSDFLTESLKANRNQRKRSLILLYSFAQKTSLVLRISTHEQYVLVTHLRKLFLTSQVFQKTSFCLVSDMFLFGFTIS